jgi:hypothetical protein
MLTRRRAFAQVRHGSNIQLLPYSLATFPARPGRSIAVHISRPTACSRSLGSKLNNASSNGWQSAWQSIRQMPRSVTYHAEPGIIVACPRSTTTSSRPSAGCGPPSAPSRSRSSATTRATTWQRRRGAVLQLLAGILIHLRSLLRDLSTQCVRLHESGGGKPLVGARGFGTAANDQALEALGVKQVRLQRNGTAGKARRAWEQTRPFRRLRNWRVGIEARISHLKRGFGLRRTGLRRLGGARTWVGLGIFVTTCLPTRSSVRMRLTGQPCCK